MSAHAAAPEAAPGVPDGHQPPPPIQMVGMLAGFQVSQALYVAAKLDIATALRDGPLSLDDLATATGAPAETLTRLMRTLASLGVFAEHSPGRYRLTPLGATLAVGEPGSVRDLALTWMETHYLPFSRLLDAVTTGRPAADLHYGMPFFDWLGTHPDQARVFTGAMANLTTGVKHHALDGYRLPPGETVADIGGADGTVLAALLGRDEDRNRRGIVFDLPHVVCAAGDRLAGLGLQDRIETVGGDFFESVPPADVYLVSMILHDWDDSSCLRLLRALRAAARPQARFVALEFVVPPGDGPHMSKMIDLTMLGMLTGHERTAEEFDVLLDNAGLRLDFIVETSTPLSFIEATFTSD